MVSDLPEALRILVTEYLLNNRFQEAKAVHDAWQYEQAHQPKTEAQPG